MDSGGRGRREFLALMGAVAGATIAGMRPWSPSMAAALIEDAFAGAPERADLDHASLELATIAVLAALGGGEPRLEAHARAALSQGWTAAELRALCEHVSAHVGGSRASRVLSAVDRVLAEAGLPRPPALRRIALRDHETVVASRGETGPAVVLIHALGLDWRMWEPLMTALAVGRRVFAYDLRGHGSATGAPPPRTMNDLAADLFRLLDVLGLEQPHVVGLSYGGGIAQTAAIAHPARFLSLSLLATTDFPFETFEARARAAEADGMAAQIAPSITRWFTPESIATNPWGVRYARECILRDDAADWAAAWRGFKSLDVQHRLTDFAAPVLVMAGEKDLSCPPDLMAGIAQRISNASFRVLPTAPHMMSLETPALVAKALNDFLPSAPIG